MTLTAQAVHKTLLKCLFTEAELESSPAGEGRPPEGAVIVEGVMQKFGFHPDRLMENRETIRLLLAELPSEFRTNEGGGWSFLNACMDKNDHQWGEHRDIEALLVLGLASGQAQYVLPRAMWSAFPGGMPYFSVTVS